MLVYLQTLYPVEDIPGKSSFRNGNSMGIDCRTSHADLSKIKINNIVKNEESIQTFIDEKTKTSDKNMPQPILYLPFFKNHPKLCLASILEAYIHKTKDIPPSDLVYLIFTTKNPFHAATPQTISRWIKLMITQSGINTTLYSSYIIKHSAVSTASLAGANIEVIRNVAGWSEKSTVFCSL